MFLFAVVVLAATGPNPFLAEAKVHYQGLDYAKCLKRLEQADLWKSTLEEEAEVALYRGLCSFGQGKADEGRAQLRRALSLSSTVALPSYTSPRIREVFEEERARLAPVETPAPSPPVLVPSAPPVVEAPLPKSAEPSRPRVRLAVPILGGVAVAGLATGIGLGVRARQLEQDSFRQTFSSDIQTAGDGARAFATGANASYALAGAAAISAGVLLIIDLVESR